MIVEAVVEILSQCTSIALARDLVTILVSPARCVQCLQRFELRGEAGFTIRDRGLLVIPHGIRPSFFTFFVIAWFNRRGRAARRGSFGPSGIVLGRASAFAQKTRLPV